MLIITLGRSELFLWSTVPARQHANERCKMMIIGSQTIPLGDFLTSRVPLVMRNLHDHHRLELLPDKVVGVELLIGRETPV